MKKIITFDSTLRDGAQAEGISFSVGDKLKIVRLLDELGIMYIEAGNPGSNPKDLEFFEKMRDVKLKNSRLTAFGSTRRAGAAAADDKNIRSLLSADTPAVAIFGKCWDFHVTDVIRTTLDENLAMIGDTLAYLKSKGKEVIFDCEHFFDGYKHNAEYAVKCLEAAAGAGADCLVLCDTNGGCHPFEIVEIVKQVKAKFSVDIGIHCHNDCGMAVANTMLAVSAGAVHIQGTFIGFGERCGNTNLSTCIANLQLKEGYDCIPPEAMAKLTAAAHFMAEVSNMALDERMPYVGRSAFAHKGGMHIDGVSKNPLSFEHVEPGQTGNERRFLTSEVAGRTQVLSHIQRVAPQLLKDSPETERIIARLKELEHEGYQFEGADSTFELIIRKSLGRYKPFFELINFKIIGEQPYTNGMSASALIKIAVDGKVEVTAAEGEGPVNALDKALRKALEVFYPALSKVHLTDFKVRVMDSASATASKVRVLIESSDGVSSWTTVGVSADVIEASWIALVDSIEYKLIKDLEKQFQNYLM